MVKRPKGTFIARAPHQSSRIHRRPLVRPEPLRPVAPDRGGEEHHRPGCHLGRIPQPLSGGRSMRKFLLATVCLMALTAHRPTPSTSSSTPCRKLRASMQLAHWVEQFAAMKQQYDQLVYDLQRAGPCHRPVGQCRRALGGLTRNLHAGSAAIPDLMATPAICGAGLATSTITTSTTPSSHDRPLECTEMERRRAVTSNAKAMAEASTFDAQDHLMRLGDTAGPSVPPLSM